MTDSLAKVAAKKAIHLPPRIDLSMSGFKNANRNTQTNNIVKWVR